MDRNSMIEALAEYWTDAMDLDALIEFFRAKQIEHLEAMSDLELIEEYKNNIEGNV